MSRDVCVHSWSCSYYLALEKRWVPGRLSLTPRTLKFTADRAGEVLVGLPLASVVEIRKETSHFIFSAITILERGHLKHWFSSLRPSRNVVFSVVEHFWRELLLSRQGTATELASSTPARGQELIGLMTSSQRRLEDTAKVLHHQGEQLDSVMKGLEKMESDLDVADRLLTELESPSWWPFSSKLWKTPEEAKPREIAPVATSEPCGKEGVVIQVPAVVSGRAESHTQPGQLTVLVSALEIHDSNATLLHRFRRGEVDSVRVHSPYEVSVRQRCIGKPDVAFRLLSARMPEVIPVLEVQFSEKVELLGDAAGLSSSGPADTEQAERAGAGHRGRAGATGRGLGRHHHRCGACHPDHGQAHPAHEAAGLGAPDYKAAAAGVVCPLLRPEAGRGGALQPTAVCTALTPAACGCVLHCPSLCLHLFPAPEALEKDCSPWEAGVTACPGFASAARALCPRLSLWWPSSPAE
ncbi:PREDICTED: synaptosomal-associated protein 47 isoform X1 [Chinchilla lanigera]|uniref:synaptosomal-associated protein 47 isoform X1 n=1 Tax=Chinchilla lanigera TaxID=34839 RepID=UPI00038F0AA2|nr:PREDICTED: synaptosomal-associated protein 47 isoform X1 [Chinchilla lanigera]XP_013365192.1 PREDICTED: synaptosomal-associated protein 47 isoform X1 [Chinchilla lanigera]